MGLSYKCRYCNAPGAKTWRKHCASCALKDPEVKTEGVSLVEAMKLFNLSTPTSPSSSLETFNIGHDNIKDSNDKIDDPKPFPVLQSFNRCPGIIIPVGYLLKDWSTGNGLGSSILSFESLILSWPMVNVSSEDEGLVDVDRLNSFMASTRLTPSVLTSGSFRAHDAQCLRHV